MERASAPWQSRVPQRRAMYSETLAAWGVPPPDGIPVNVDSLGQANVSLPPSPTHDRSAAPAIEAASAALTIIHAFTTHLHTWDRSSWGRRRRRPPSLGPRR